MLRIYYPVIQFNYTLVTSVHSCAIMTATYLVLKGHPDMWIFHRIFSQDWSFAGIAWSVLGGMAAGLIFTQVSSLATTLGLHRSMTHRAYTLHPFLNWLFRLILWLSVGIKWWEWCRVHAYHHQHTETRLDGHSPMYKGGVSGVTLHNPGLYQRSAHDPVVITATAQQFRPDKWDRLLFDREGLGRALGILSCVSLFGIIPGVIAYVVHIYAYIILNGAINVIGHGAEPTGVDNRLEHILQTICQRSGKRPGYNPVTARQRMVGNSLNFQWLAWITMGEGLHYNHHFAPRSPTMRRFKGDHDPGLYFLYGLRALRLIGNFRLPALERLPS